MTHRNKGTAIAALQAAFDRLPGSVAPPLKVREAYVSGSLARAVKERVGDVDLIIVLSSFSDVMEFMTRMTKFLMRPDPSETVLSEAMSKRYCKLAGQSWNVRKRLAWKRPPVREFACAQPARGILEAAGVHPEWLSLFTWRELWNWHRDGMPDGVLLTPERLVRRALFGLKQGFEVVQVAGTIEEAARNLVADQLVLVWSPEKPDVAKNLMLDDASRRTLVEKEYENVWNSLQVVNVKNTILEDLCRYYLARHLLDSRNAAKDAAEDPPQRFVAKWVKRSGICEGDLREFLEASSSLGISSALSVIPSLRLEKPPQLIAEATVDVLRTRLGESTTRHRVLIQLRGALHALLSVEGCPTDLASYLLDCVPFSVAPKHFTLEVLHMLGLSRRAGVFTTGIPIRAALARKNTSAFGP